MRALPIIWRRAPFNNHKRIDSDQGGGGGGLERFQHRIWYILATVRLKIVGNESIQNVGKYESCMVSKLMTDYLQTDPYRCEPRTSIPRDCLGNRPKDGHSFSIAKPYD